MTQHLRAAQTLLAALLIACFCLGASCQTTGPGPGPGPGPDEPFGVGGPDDPEIEDDARQKMAEAAQLLEDGRHLKARDLYRAVAANYDAAAGPASVMAAVAECRAGRVREALSALDALAEDGDQQSATRRGAMGYHALCAADNKRRTDALASLARYPDPRPSTLWLESDAVRILWLLADARRRAKRPMEALGALSWAYELSPPESKPTARAWAMDILRSDANSDQLRTALESQDDFTLGLASAALILGALDAGATDIETLSALYQAIAPSLVRLDEAELAAELSQRLAAAAGPVQARIGVLLPLTGRDRRVGARALDGILLAQGVYSPSRSPRSTLVIEDTGSSADGARAAFERLAEQGVSAVIGPLDNSEARAAADAAESLEVPMIALGIDADLPERGPWVFRHFLDNARETDALMRQAHARGARSVAILYPDVRFGRAISQLAADKARAHGLTVAVSVGYDPKASDFSTLARKLRRSQADAVFIPDVAGRVSQILPFMATEKIWCAPPAQDIEGHRTVLCLGNTTWVETRLLRDAGTYARGALIAAGYARLIDTPSNTAFVQSWSAQVGGEPSFFAAYAYDTARLVRELVLARNLTDRTQVREALEGLRGFEGLAGAVKVSGAGDLGADPVLITVQGKDFVLVGSP